jgi:single-strand DNA-binding protein
VKVFGAQAAAVASRLAKGSRVGVGGRLEWSCWEKDGTRRSKVEIVANNVQFLDSAGAGEPNDDDGIPF